MSRIENDFLGSLEIPDDVYYGVQTMRGKHPLNQLIRFALSALYISYRCFAAHVILD